MESVGFKEWALVCEALGCGEQSVILRKGGIAEGRAGFGFRETEFFLFPTFFHEQMGKIRTVASEIPAPRAGEIEIKYFAKLEFAGFLDSWEKVIALEPFHILQRDVVRERFDYDAASGIHVGVVRVYRLSRAGSLRMRRALADVDHGCRCRMCRKGQSLQPCLATKNTIVEARR